jgi:hypothetical protein
MTFRRSALLAVPLVLAACTNVTPEAQPATLVFATFDSTTGTIPTPNDLALQAVPTLTQPLQAAQRELLQAFIDAGGFPSDQEVPVTIPIRAVKWDAATGAYVPAPAPTVDLATVTTSTVAVLSVGGGVSTVAFEAVASPGKLVIRKKADASGSRRWTPGARYVVALRGGPGGVKTTTGLPVNADQGIALVAPNLDLANPNNQPPGGLPAPLVAQLKGLQAALWSPLAWARNGAGLWTPAPSGSVTGAFPAVRDHAFPPAEVAAITGFGVAPSAGTVALIDSGSGEAPLPIDLIRTGAGGTIAFNAAFGAAAAGLTTLDGFSTTAMLLAPTSDPIDAATVNAGSVFV